MNWAETFYDGTAGHATMEEAVDAYVEEIRKPATVLAASPDFAVAAHLFEPMRSFDVARMVKVADDLAYYDLPTDESDFLDARIVVEGRSGSFVVTESYICERTLVTDSAPA